MFDGRIFELPEGGLGWAELKCTYGGRSPAVRFLFFEGSVRAWSGGGPVKINGNLKALVPSQLLVVPLHKQH